LGEFIRNPARAASGLGRKNTLRISADDAFEELLGFF
jgi:hypothetical protein